MHMGLKIKGESTWQNVVWFCQIPSLRIDEDIEQTQTIPGFSHLVVCRLQKPSAEAWPLRDH